MSEQGHCEQCGNYADICQDCLDKQLTTLQKDNDRLKAEVEKVNRKNADIWAILNGLGLKMYSEDETIQMVWERAEKAEAAYNDLIMQVANVTPNETRHESAKRIIHDHENQTNEECASINHKEK